MLKAKEVLRAKLSKGEINYVQYKAEMAKLKETAPKEDAVIEHKDGVLFSGKLNGNSTAFSVIMGERQYGKTSVANGKTGSFPALIVVFEDKPKKHALMAIRSVLNYDSKDEIWYCKAVPNALENIQALAEPWEI